MTEYERAHGLKLGRNAEKIWGWNSPTGQLRAARRAQILIDLGQIKPGDKVLEIGCGTGVFTKEVFFSTKADLTAIDISEYLLEVAKAKIEGVIFRIDDAMDMDFQDQAFDVVFGSSILHHLDQKKAFKEIFRVLKPSGRIIFAEPNMLNPQIFIQKNIPFIKRRFGDTPGEKAIIRWKTKKLLVRMGFKKTKLIPYDFLHPAIPRSWIKWMSSAGLLLEKLPLLKEIAGSVIIYAEKP